MSIAPAVAPSVAKEWLDRWDRQQTLYVPDREERFAVIADVVAARAGEEPLVVDLGVGPGSLSVRLLDRFPSATVVGVDADPLLLGLAASAYGDRDGLRLVDADLRRPGWVDALALPRPADAVVSTTALHWLTRPELAAVYTEVARLLAPGGVFVDGDHLAEPSTRPGLGDVVEAVSAARTERRGVGANEDWGSWWGAVDAAPELAPLRAGRVAGPIDHRVPDVPTLADHVELLLAAGFAEAGTVWQHGDDRVLVGLR